MGQPELARGKPKMSRDQDFVTIASTRNHNPAYCKVKRIYYCESLIFLIVLFDIFSTLLMATSD